MNDQKMNRFLLNVHRCSLVTSIEAVFWISASILWTNLLLTKAGNRRQKIKSNQITKQKPTKILENPGKSEKGQANIE